MAQRIVCTEQTGCSSSGHILAIGVGVDASRATKRLTVSEVWSAIDRGEVFYTSDGRTQAVVEKFYCGCGRGSLRTKPDASKANNLDNLRICHFNAA